MAFYEERSAPSFTKKAPEESRGLEVSGMRAETPMQRFFFSRARARAKRECVRACGCACMRSFRFVFIFFPFGLFSPMGLLTLHGFPSPSLVLCPSVLTAFATLSWGPVSILNK